MIFLEILVEQYCESPIIPVLTLENREEIFDNEIKKLTNYIQIVNSQYLFTIVIMNFFVIELPMVA